LSGDDRLDQEDEGVDCIAKAVEDEELVVVSGEANFVAGGFDQRMFGGLRGIWKRSYIALLTRCIFELSIGSVCSSCRISPLPKLLVSL
jgi:hypothetical protein